MLALIMCVGMNNCVAQVWVDLFLKNIRVNPDDFD
jgi:hypothetical protein